MNSGLNVNINPTLKSQNQVAHTAVVGAVSVNETTLEQTHAKPIRIITSIAGDADLNTGRVRNFKRRHSETMHMMMPSDETATPNPRIPVASAQRIG
jgi:hypothetical protein